MDQKEFRSLLLHLLVANNKIGGSGYAMEKASLNATRAPTQQVLSFLAVRRYAGKKGRMPNGQDIDNL